MIRWNSLVGSPLPAAWRSRLEIAFAAVMSGAAVVAAASAIRPDPAHVAELQHLAPLRSTPPSTEPPRLALRPMQTMELLDAATAGNVGALQRAYRPGMSVDGLLTRAAASGHEDAVRWLVGHGASIDEGVESPTAPILVADEFPKVVATLQELGAREPALATAARVNAANAFARGLAAHPGNAKIPGMLAAAAGATQGTAANKRLMVTKLLEAGADPRADAALASAVRSCDASGGSPEVAVDCMTFVRLLLDRGANVTGEAIGAALALPDAIRAAPLDALLERPLAPGVATAALAQTNDASAEDLKRIVKLGVDWAWHDGETDEALPLLDAARRGVPSYVRALLEAGAPVDVQYKDGVSALGEAIDRANGDEDGARIVELLVNKGANVNRRLPDGRTPLYAAAESGSIRVVQFLLAHGARVNEMVLYETARDAAEERSNLAVARILHAHGGASAHPTTY